MREAAAAGKSRGKKAVATDHPSTVENPRRQKLAARAEEPAKRNRSSRSRDNTRRKLIDAALKVMSEKGIDGTAIADITEAADVGFGSFYNHFSSKSEIASAVFAHRARELAAVTDIIARTEPDAAVAAAYSQKAFLARVIADPVWGWFMIRAHIALPEVDAAFSQQCEEAVRRGQAQGRFSVQCVDTAVSVLLSGLIGVSRWILSGRAPRSAMNDTVECLLRMLGVPPEEALRLSRLKEPRYVQKLLKELRSRDEPAGAGALE
jgi:AcrR family transcriptional regulator